MKKAALYLNLPVHVQTYFGNEKDCGERIVSVPKVESVEAQWIQLTQKGFCYWKN
jgi:hypothetical protein